MTELDLAKRLERIVTLAQHAQYALEVNAPGDLWANLLDLFGHVDEAVREVGEWDD